MDGRTVYAKFAHDSSVQVVRTEGGSYWCQHCTLDPDTEDHGEPGPQEMLSHLSEHEKAGHSVRVQTFEWLREDLQQGFDGRADGGAR